MVGKKNALFGDSVEMGRLDVGMAHIANVLAAMPIRADEYEVRPFVLFVSGVCC